MTVLHMFPNSTAVLPSTCLRYQLRRVIVRTGKRISSTQLTSSKRAVSRAFHASTFCQQHIEDQHTDDNASSYPKPKLSEFPLGRIHGKPGRKHRETSARLSQDSLQKPFEVVVLRDVPDAKEETTVMSNHTVQIQEVGGADASQIAREVLGQDDGSNDTEIFESIDTLQPQATIIDQEEYQILTKNLIDSYNTRQLSRYFSNSLDRMSAEWHDKPLVKESKKRQNEIQILAWRPEKLPSGRIRKDDELSSTFDITSSKSKLVEQILRRSWNLSIDSENHQFGYLEMRLKPWQLSFLFDIYRDSKPMYEIWADSSLLLRSSELRPDRADNVLRIIARKRDAEEFAELIERRFREFESIELDMTPLNALGGSGRQITSAKGLLDEPSLQAIQRRLFCVFERKDNNTYVIHAPREVTLWQARRAFVSLMKLPSPTSVESITVAHKDANVALLHEHPALELMTPSLAASFARLTEPTGFAGRNRSLYDPHSDRKDEVMSKSQARQVNNRLRAIKPPAPVTPSSGSTKVPFWELGASLRHEQWEVQICRLLQSHDELEKTKSIPKSSSNRRQGLATTSKDFSSRSTIQSEIPGIGNLLTHFSPLHKSVQSPMIVAHFLPNPFTKHALPRLANLPRIRMTYRLSTDGGPSDGAVVSLQGIRGVFAQQELLVHLPQEATDLRFVRQSTLRALRGIAFGGGDVQNFTAMLQYSLNRKRSFLDGEPMVKFPLPSSLFDGLHEPWVKDLREHNFEANYLFERFEQVQSLDLDLHPDVGASEDTDPWVKRIIGAPPPDMYLRYQEIEGGTVGGRRTELRLMCSSKSASHSRDINSNGNNTQDSEGKDVDDVAKCSQLTDMSLRIAKAVTEINARRSTST